jgi:tellurite resistance protein TehA-like permease
MEQFDKDEKLFQENNPKKKSNVKFLLIGALSTIILVILYFLLKLIKNKKESKEKENENDYSKYYFINYFFY